MYKGGQCPQEVEEVRLAFHQVGNPAFALSPCTACTFKVPLHTAVAGDDCEGGGVCCPVQGEVASGWGKVRGASARGQGMDCHCSYRLAADINLRHFPLQCFLSGPLLCQPRLAPAFTHIS